MADRKWKTKKWSRRIAEQRVWRPVGGALLAKLNFAVKFYLKWAYAVPTETAICWTRFVENLVICAKNSAHLSRKTNDRRALQHWAVIHQPKLASCMPNQTKNGGSKKTIFNRGFFRLSTTSKLTSSRVKELRTNKRLEINPNFKKI